MSFVFFLFFHCWHYKYFFFFFQAEDGIRDGTVTGVQTCALPIVLGVTDEIGEVADLQIRADRATFGGKLQLERGEFAFEALDDRHRGIVEVADSEDDLESLIVLEAEAAEILVQLAVVAPQRLEDRDG